MNLLWPALAVLVAVGGGLALRRTRARTGGEGLSDEELAALERGGSVERPDPLDLDEIAEAERRHDEQTWDRADPDAL